MIRNAFITVQEKLAGGRFWLVPGVGVLLIAILFGVIAVTAIPQFQHWRARLALASGQAAVRNREYDKAVAKFNEAIELDPSLAVAFNDRGVVWLRKKEYDKALADFHEALRLKPALVGALVNCGNAWYQKGNYDKAVADCSEAIRLDPKAANAFHNRGLAWIGKNEYDKALADCNEALRLDPKSAYAVNDRGVAWDGKGEYGKALEDCTEAIRIDPQFALAYSNLGWFRATCPDPHYRDGKQAVQNATRACALSAWQEPNRLATLAAACAEAGDFANAVKWEQKAIALAPKELVGELRVPLEHYKAHKPMRRADVHDLAECVRTWADTPTRPNRNVLLASFKASRVGVRVPPDVGPIAPGPQKLKGDMQLIPTSTWLEGRRFLLVLADVKSLAAQEPRARFAELAGNDVIELAAKEGTGIVVQALPPGRPAWAALPKELVVELGQAPPEK